MDDGLIAVEDVRARICEGCGEQFLDEETAQRIQALLKCPTMESGRQIRVPVYDLSRLGSSARRRRLRSFRSSGSEASLLCKYCTAQTVEQLVRSAFWVNGQLIALENIPARVCPECNVQFYDDETAEAIATLEETRAIPDAARRDVTVSVFSLADKENAADDRFHRDANDRFCER